uniref:Uncharacterized protein n=1 Tax=Kalanchoe fedtschenkoi TaxID=63787 RepID=A0A7N0TXL5_KALFE
MGSRKKPTSNHPSRDASISGFSQRQQKEIDRLALSSQPVKTLKFFVLAILQYIKHSLSYLIAKGGYLMLLAISVAVLGVSLAMFAGPYEKHFEEAYHYFWFVLWWVALGVASSIGLGSGLHTFVLYLGPHIAFFTIKALHCGRVDLKSSPYDTIQLKRTPSWLNKDCSEFGPPVFEVRHGLGVPLSSILPQVQLEAILWGLGTALGELPPYFISRAASLSGGETDAMGDFGEPSVEENGFISVRLNQMKRWFLSHAQHLNFFTILVLASVPNPLFDLAGIMCGQFGIPFWKFSLATLIGKALIKTHIQTVFIISVCNNQLLNWVENEFIWLLSLIPGSDLILPKLIDKLNNMRDKYLAAPPTVTAASSKSKMRKWDFSIASIWNVIVWLMLINFFIKIVNATAQNYLKNQLKSSSATSAKKSSASDEKSQ